MSTPVYKKKLIAGGLDDEAATKFQRRVKSALETIKTHPHILKSLQYIGNFK